MKLLYLANLRLPTEKAHGVQIMQMCAAFARADYHVTLAVPFRWRSRGLHGIKNVYAYYGVERNFRIVRLPSLDLFPLTAIIPFFDRFAFAVQYGTFLISLWVYVAATFKLKTDNCVVYTRDGRIARLASRFTNNVFFELHTVPKADDVAAARRARGVITVTRGLKHALIKEGFETDRALVAPDAVDFAAHDAVTGTRESLRKELHLPQDGMLIGYAGRLMTMDREKGVPELLDAFALLLETLPHARLVVIGGDASDVRRYDGMLREKDIFSRVHFISHVAPTSVPRYLKAMDILVAPFPDAEHYRIAMSPLKVFEYMASGRPMVVADLPSLREILPGSSAYFFEPGNAGALSQVIAYVAAHSAEADSRATRAHTEAGNDTWDKRSAAILDFIGSI